MYPLYDWLICEKCEYTHSSIYALIGVLRVPGLLAGGALGGVKVRIHQGCGHGIGVGDGDAPERCASEFAGCAFGLPFEVLEPRLGRGGGGG